MKWQKMIMAAWLIAWIGACTSESATSVKIPTVPGHIKAPQTERVLLEAAAKGVQIYECKPTEDSPTRLEWTLKAPEAELIDNQGQVIGRHYAGPTWESTDGSKVIGEVKARAEASKPDAIPWLLIAAKSTEGRGVFSQVKHIQRVDTTGGKPPQAGCNTSQFGHELRVPYAATYYFYVAKP